MNVLIYVTFFCCFPIFIAFQKHRSFYRQREQELNLNETFFPTLKNYYVNAKVMSESDYPWIAQVIHSRNNFVPFICNAVCIEKNIFITAARCVYLLKVAYTSLIYQNKRLTARAFVMPTNESKQMYDDIGFIIVDDDFKGEWEKVETFNEKRPDNVFKWFEDMKFDNYEHKVVGYAVKKNFEAAVPWKNNYQLTELDVDVNINLCRDILPYDNLITGFNVPCYFSCTYDEFMNDHINCDNYHGTLGGALINKKTNKLFGVATWAAYYIYSELPVGFAVPNSEAYFEDYTCALTIRDDKNSNAKEGYYQNLCDNKRKHLRKEYGDYNEINKQVYF